MVHWEPRPATAVIFERYRDSGTKVVPFVKTKKIEL